MNCRGLMIAVMLLCVGALSAQQRGTHKNYIERYKHLAIESQERYGIPASIKMAQALLESDCGNSRLAREANNHFGIKCKREWTGMTINHTDDAPDECFRKYATVEDSFLDHSDFLDRSPRYQSLFELDPTDYKGWARGLKAAGYATNPRYAELLIGLIEEHGLYLLDSGLDPAAPPTAGANADMNQTRSEHERLDPDDYVVSTRVIGQNYALYINNGSEFVLARSGDTYRKLASVTRVKEKKLRKFNDASATDEPVAGAPVYIKTKSNRSENGKLMHVVTAGETMHSISQKYGIKLKKLEQINRRSAASVLRAGQQIRLM